MSGASFCFFVNDTSTTESYTLSLHDALPISSLPPADSRKPLSTARLIGPPRCPVTRSVAPRSEEHTSELQSHHDLVCRLLLEKKKDSPWLSDHCYMSDIFATAVYPDIISRCC